MDDKRFSRTSLKVNVGEVSSSNGIHTNGGRLEKPAEPKFAREVYKPIDEDSQIPKAVVEESKNPNAVKRASIKEKAESPLKSADDSESSEMVQEENINDGADEQMLGTDENEKLAAKREEVKFIRGDHQNGDAKIDIGGIDGKAFTGMTKEELMKYANDPFWVRLRWIFFVAFWAIWVGMLVGAILIIVEAPKCPAPKPLPWYQSGLLAKFSANEVGSGDLAAAQKLQATGAIYELPPEMTYAVKDPEVEQKIKDILATFKESDVNVVLDITPNYVSKNSALMQDALADETKRSAFIWMPAPSVPNNWLSLVNGSAWTEVQPGNFVLSQFGDGLFDLNMNDTIVRQALNDSLTHLVHLGVRGFRLKNSKFFLLAKNIQDEVPSTDPKYIHTQYEFWTHSQTTFQDGLGDLMADYSSIVKSASPDAFLTVAEDVVRPENYKTSGGDFAIDVINYGRVTKFLSASRGAELHPEMDRTYQSVGVNSWLQLDYTDLQDDAKVNPSAAVLFLSFWPGVPIVPIDSAAYRNVSEATYKHIQQLRTSPSFMHGDVRTYETNQVIAYSRIKSGSPGYFVVFNPTNKTQVANFEGFGLPDKMSVNVLSENYNVTDISVQSDVMTNAIEVSRYATMILTYVPVKAG